MDGNEFCRRNNYQRKKLKLIDEYYKRLSDNCLGDNKSDSMSYWQNNCSFQYSKMLLLFIFGYYNEGKPVFYTGDFNIEINNNRINNMYVHKDLYDKLEL